MDAKINIMYTSSANDAKSRSNAYFYMRIIYKELFNPDALLCVRKINGMLYERKRGFKNLNPKSESFENMYGPYGELLMFWSSTNSMFLDAHEMWWINAASKFGRKRMHAFDKNDSMCFNRMSLNYVST